MLRTTSWVGVAILCAGAVGAGGQDPVPAPPPREKSTDADWLPKPGSDPHPGIKTTWVGPDGTRTEIRKIGGLATDPPSAFPDLVAPVIPKGGRRSTLRPSRSCARDSSERSS